MEIKEYSPTEAGLTDIKSRMEGVTYDVTNVLGMAQAKRDRKELVTLRVSLEGMRKTLKAPALERSRLIDAEATRIKALIIILEEPIDKQIKAEEKRLSDIKEEKRLAAQKRDMEIMESITKLSTMVDRVSTFHAAKLQECIDFINSMELTEEKFLTFLPLAIEARDKALKEITEIQTAKAEAEAEADRIETKRLADLETERVEREAADKKLKEDQETLRLQQEEFDKQKEETDRVNGIKAKIEADYGPGRLNAVNSLTSKGIGVLIEQFQVVCTEDVFAELTREADCKREDLIRSLTGLQAAAKEREAAAEQLKKDQEKVAEDKRIADDLEKKRLGDAAKLAEEKRVDAVREKQKLASAKKLSDAKCADASTAFKQILVIIEKAETAMSFSEKLAEIQIIAEANQ